MNKHVNTLFGGNANRVKNAASGCGECAASCQSACKTSCTVGNQKCENPLVGVKSPKAGVIRK